MSSRRIKLVKLTISKILKYTFLIKRYRAFYDQIDSRLYAKNTFQAIDLCIITLI